MTELTEMAVTMALTQLSDLSQAKLAREVRDLGSARRVLEERGYLQADLFEPDRESVGLVQHYESRLMELASRDIRALSISCPAFPSHVAQLKSPPLFLFYRGVLDPDDYDGVAIIGSRRVSSEALRVANEWSRELARQGTVVVSGLAAGIDRQAHLGALSQSSRTVAVIGTGIDRVYPPENAELQEEIAAKHLVVSQFLPDAPPTKASFPMRNAVMAAWARTTLVIDADERSGAALQARLASEQGRDLCFHDRLRAQTWATKFVETGDARFVDRPEDVLVRTTE